MTTRWRGMACYWMSEIVLSTTDLSPAPNNMSAVQKHHSSYIIVTFHENIALTSDFELRPLLPTTTFELQIWSFYPWRYVQKYTLITYTKYVIKHCYVCCMRKSIYSIFLFWTIEMLAAPLVRAFWQPSSLLSSAWGHGLKKKQKTITFLKLISTGWGPVQYGFVVDGHM